jgi:hypothetical protein
MSAQAQAALSKSTGEYETARKSAMNEFAKN